jgi:hypothetical protein
MPRQVKSAKAACNGTTKGLNLTRTCFLSNGDSGRGARGLYLSSGLSGRNGAIISQLSETLHAVQGYGNQGLAVKTQQAPPHGSDYGERGIQAGGAAYGSGSPYFAR